MTLTLEQVIALALWFVLTGTFVCLVIVVNQLRIIIKRLSK